MAPDLAVLVIDNASTDTTTTQVRAKSQVQLVANNKNRGFAGAVNQAFASTTEDYLLILNPDVRLRTSIDPLVRACLNRGIAAGLLTDDLGRPQRGFSLRQFPSAVVLTFELLGLNRIWPSNSVNQRYRCLRRDLEAPGDVEQPAGAMLAVRRDVWERLGGFDEGFHPVWFEDVDFCKRAHDAGIKSAFVPEVRAAHSGGDSVNVLGFSQRNRFWYVSLLRYAAKHFRPTAYRTVCLAAMCSAVPRMIAGILRERSWTPITTCIEILSLAARSLVSTPRLAERLG
jgi:N-acetylglucosaminyl-diphospho-decaprenol L-rhamnosyltransferase